MVEISGVGLEAARLSSEKLVKKGAKTLINAGICEDYIIELSVELYIEWHLFLQRN